jgi:hypothetical protein
MAYNTAVIRELINAAFSDQELTTFCYDHFRSVFDQFAADMNRQRKIQLLLEYSENQAQLEELLARIEQVNPVQYHKYEPWLFTPGQPSTVSQFQSEGASPGEAALPKLIQSPSSRVDLKATEKTLLQQLFADCHYLVVEQAFGGGFSSTRVLRVTPWREGLELAAQVVKLGPLPLIADEKERHDRYVKDNLPLLAAQITRFAYQDNQGAMAYTFIGGPVLGQPLLLKDYYLHHPPDQIEAVLQRLLDRALGHCWYGKRLPVQGPTFFEQFYGRYFPADLTLTVEALGQGEPPLPPPRYKHFPPDMPTWDYRQVKPKQLLQVEGFRLERQKGQRLDLVRIDNLIRLRVNFKPKAKLPYVQPEQPIWLRGRVTGRRGDELTQIATAIFDDPHEIKRDFTATKISLGGRLYPNPLTHYQAYLDRSLPANLAITHGDLHLLNVIVDSDHKPWLIDFGRVEEGHTIFDFVELETHLRHIILGEIDFKLADLADFERRLIQATIAATPPPPLVNPDLAKAFAVIRSIRTLAANYLARRDDFQGEYLPALLLYSLSTLRHYKDNGSRSARHAFVTAAVLGAYLGNQLDALAPALTIRDPSLYQHVYYLKKAADDTPAQEVTRQDFFRAELQQVADAIRRFLGLPSMPVAWNNQPPAGPNQMILRYNSGQWQDASGQTLAWLIAHEANDTYILRLILCRLGAEHAPSVFADLRQQLPWQPDSTRPELLGQTFFYTGLSDAPASEMARAVFDTPSLLHTCLTCGELYRPRSPEAPHLLIFASEAQEHLANTFFSQMALELGWYTCKVIRQVKEYENYLYQAIKAVEQKVAVMLARAQSLQPDLSQGDGDAGKLAAFRQHLRALEMALLEFDKLLVTARAVLTGITINTENYRRVTEPGEFLDRSNQDEIFAEQRRQLEYLPSQIKYELEYWQLNLAQARNESARLKAAWR